MVLVADVFPAPGALLGTLAIVGGAVAGLVWYIRALVRRSQPGESASAAPIRPELPSARAVFSIIAIVSLATYAVERDVPGVLSWLFIAVVAPGLLGAGLVSAMGLIPAGATASTGAIVVTTICAIMFWLLIWSVAGPALARRRAASALARGE